MTFKVEFRPEAFADVAEAFSYYEGQRIGLGAEFEAELDETVQPLRQMARAGPVVYRDLRRVLMQRFPFAVYLSPLTFPGGGARCGAHQPRSTHLEAQGMTPNPYKASGVKRA